MGDIIWAITLNHKAAWAAPTMEENGPNGSMTCYNWIVSHVIIGDFLLE